MSYKIYSFAVGTACCLVCWVAVEATSSPVGLRLLKASVHVDILLARLINSSEVIVHGLRTGRSILGCSSWFFGKSFCVHATIICRYDFCFFYCCGMKW